MTDHSVTVIKDGQLLQAKPEYPGMDQGSTTADIKSTEVAEDGSVVYTYKDGTIETHHPPQIAGGMTLEYPEGTVVYKDP